jgi:hypothetical protein
VDGVGGHEHPALLSLGSGGVQPWGDREGGGAGAQGDSGSGRQPQYLPSFAPMQAHVYWDATVVTNDPVFPEHESWNDLWMAEVR